MKKGIALLLAAVVAVAGAGCSDGAAAENSAPGTNGDGQARAEEIAGEITLSCYDSLHTDFLEHTARAFEDAYPGTKINIDTVASVDMKSSDTEEGQRMVIEADGDVQAQMDYITGVNTTLMSGGGADIYAMDVLPYYKYAENGQLEDLQSYMEGDEEFRADDYRMNVVEALKYKGGQYVFPLDYSFCYYAFDKTLFGEDALRSLQSAERFSIDELFQIAEKSGANGLTGHKIAGIRGYQDPAAGTSVFHEMFLNNYASFIDLESKTANFTDGTFEQLLEKVKTWEDQGYIEQSGSAGLSVEDFAVSSGERYFYKLHNNIELLLATLRAEGWQISIPVAGVSPSTYEDDVAAGMGAGADGSITFSYGQAYGINSNSPNKSLAWEFIKFMASQEIQENLQLYPMGLMGLPVHNEARMSKAKDGITGELFGLSDGFGGEQELTAVQQAALADYLSTVERFSDMLNVYPVTDVTIDDIINAEVNTFFTGKASAAEVANTIQSKVNRYLNE